MLYFSVAGVDFFWDQNTVGVGARFLLIRRVPSEVAASDVGRGISGGNGFTVLGSNVDPVFGVCFSLLGSSCLHF